MVQTVEKILKDNGLNFYRIGSSSHEALKNYPDIDLKMIIPDFTEDIKNKIINAINEVNKYHPVIEFKGITNTKFVRGRSFKDIQDIKNLNVLKFDIIQNLSGNLTPIDLFIIPKYMDNNFLFNVLIQNEIDKGDYYKALKRYMGKLRQTGEDDGIINRIYDLVNSKIGEYYKAIKIINMLQQLKKYFSSISSKQEDIKDKENKLTEKIKRLSNEIKSDTGLNPDEVVKNFIKKYNLF